MTQVLAITDPATEKQINFLTRLLAERIEDPEAALDAIEWLETHRLSKATASAKIEEYLAKPKVRRADTASALDEGMYKVGDDIYKVYRTRETDVLVTKTLTEDGFEYTGRKPLAEIKPEHRMTLEEAKAYGKVTGTCCQCGRKLTKEESIAAGIGPICAGKF